MSVDANDWAMAMETLGEQFEADNPFGRLHLTVNWGELSGVLSVLVAASEAQRARGMVGRRFEGFDAMLFIFPQLGPVRFHNLGVAQDLTVAFYDEFGEKVEEALLEAQVGEVSCSTPVRYALELSAGVVPDSIAMVPPALVAQQTKMPKDQVDLRPADPAAPETCQNCTFFLGNGLCELVEKGAGIGMVCDQFTMKAQMTKAWP